MKTDSIRPSRGVVVAGTCSSGGKTLISALLISALRVRGMPVQAFKVGPDYIDPGYSAHYAGRATYNLDHYMMGEQRIRDVVARRTFDAVGVVEGVMGLFDGTHPTSAEGSTWGIAGLLGWPVFLVIPAARQGRSIRAIVRGFMEEGRPDSRITGIILNRVSGDAHAEYLRSALADLSVPVLGAVPELSGVDWPERHLGLRASQEYDLPPMERLAGHAGSHLDMDAIVARLKPQPQALPQGKSGLFSKDRFGVGSRIGIAMDRAFHFYYPSSLDAVREWGFELCPFSPISDQRLPEGLDGLIIGGGFPEIFARELAANESMRMAIRDFVESGGPCYAECGGLMYLTGGIVPQGSGFHPMVGILPGQVHMKSRLQRFGYTEGCFDPDKAGYRGHEFHHSAWDRENDCGNLWHARRSTCGSMRKEGYRYKNLHASYIHLEYSTAEALFRDLFGRQDRRGSPSHQPEYCVPI